MTPILVDTNAYAAFKRGVAEALDIFQSAQWIVFNTTVLGELYGGFALGTREAQNRQELQGLLALSQVRIVTIDHGTAERYAEVYAALRRAGTPIPTNDLWIAASALQHGCDLYTYDSHFQAIPQLRCGRSAADFGWP